MSILSERLRQLRGETSQAAMARDLEMPRQQWINYENGKNAPGADILAKICRVHAVSADWLLGLKDHSSAVVASAPGGIAVVGSHNSIATPGDSPSCQKCPYKKKLKALEKLISK